MMIRNGRFIGHGNRDLGPATERPIQGAAVPFRLEIHIEDRLLRAALKAIDAQLETFGPMLESPEKRDLIEARRRLAGPLAHTARPK